MTTPVLPYAGTSGWSGSPASRDRALSDDADGTTSRRQSDVLTVLARAGTYGATWKEVGLLLDLHHGQASGALSVLHKVGRVERLAVRRARCHVYVLPEHVGDQQVSPYHPNRQRAVENILTDLIAELRELHYRVTPTQLSRGEPYALSIKVCRTCRHDWPCATARILDRYDRSSG